MSVDHDHFMRLALDEARKADTKGDTPVAAIIVKEGRIVGVGRNEVASRRDSTLHAETVAIGEASRALGSSDLKGCTLYSTMEPCPMCCWAIAISGIERLVLGARNAALGHTDLGRYTAEALLEMTGRSLDILTGVRTQECEDYRREWSRRTGRIR